MTDGLAFIGLSLVLVDADLLVLALLVDFAIDAGAFNIRGSDFGGFPTDEENFADGDFAPGFRVDFLNVDLVADGDLDLLSTRFDDCVHGYSSLLLFETRYGGGGCT